MLLSGHLLIDQRGVILEADEAFTRLFQARPGSLTGRDVISLTAPADRRECSQAIRDLIATRRSFDIVKRFIRDDQSVLWTRNSVSLMTANEADLVVATCAPVTQPGPRRTPASLLTSAREQVAMIRDREQVCDPALISGLGWQALLHVYIAEAEGRAVDVAGLARMLGQGPELVRRWIGILVTNGVLEVETRDLDPHAPKSYRLAGGAAQRLENHLARFGLGEPLPAAVGW